MNSLLIYDAVMPKLHPLFYGRLEIISVLYGGQPKAIRRHGHAYDLGIIDYLVPLPSDVVSLSYVQLWRAKASISEGCVLLFRKKSRKERTRERMREGRIEEKRKGSR